MFLDCGRRKGSPGRGCRGGISTAGGTDRLLACQENSIRDRGNRGERPSSRPDSTRMNGDLQPRDGAGASRRERTKRRHHG